MGLDIGGFRVEYLPRPSGIAYKFAWAVVEEESTCEYAWGEGHSWGWVERAQLDALLDRFAGERGLSAEQRGEVSAWLDSLPWTTEDMLELHFSW